jgi:hypothetical protein
MNTPQISPRAPLFSGHFGNSPGGAELAEPSGDSLKRPSLHDLSQRRTELIINDLACDRMLLKHVQIL